MTTVKPTFAAQSTVISTELNSLANSGAASSTSEIDNTTNLYMDGLLDCYIAAAGATTGSVSVYATVGSATGELSSTAKTSNMRLLGMIELNGTTAVRKQLVLSPVPKFWKLRIINNSGAALAASGNLVKLTGVNFTDA